MDAERLDRACRLWTRQSYGFLMAGKHFPGDEPRPYLNKYDERRAQTVPLDPKDPEEAAHIKHIREHVRTAVQCWLDAEHSN